MIRCDSCRNISKCAICGTSSEGFHHVGVRGTTNRLRIPVINYNVTYDAQPSGVWHYSQPCNHRVYPAAASSIVKYNGGPPFEDGYHFQDNFFGRYYARTTSLPLVEKIELNVAHP